MRNFVIRALVAAIGLWVADAIVGGISFDSGAWMLIAAAVLGMVNAFVRPVAVLLTLPLTIVTLGFFLLVVNGLMLGLAALLVPGFHVAGFWAAVFGALIVSIVSWMASFLIGGRDRDGF